MRHKRLLIIFTCLVFAAVCVMCATVLFSVSDITVNYSVYRAESYEEVQSLLAKYKGQNIFLLDEKEIMNDLSADRSLKVLSVEKKYPSELVVNLKERAEKFCYKADGGYYVFDEEYFVLRRSDDKVNALTGEQLVEVGFCDLDGKDVAAECAVKSTFVFPQNLNEVFSAAYGQFRTVGNVKKAEIAFTEQKGNFRFRFYMTEGVTIEIIKAGDRGVEKTAAGIAFYEKSTESIKIEGKIIVLEKDDGQISVVHTLMD